MSTKATAARIYEYGEPDVFRFETMDVPVRVGHEVLVRNTVIGLNFVDIYYRRGTLPVPEFPAIIGDEASGVVEAVGPNVIDPPHLITIPVCLRAAETGDGAIVRGERCV